MSAPDSRFQAQNKTTQQRVSDQTVGLVKLSDFRKRRAEVLEQQEREVREAAVAATSGGNNSGIDRSQTNTPDPHATNSDASNGNEQQPAKDRQKKKLLGNKKRKVGGGAKSKLSFGDDDEEDGGGEDTGKEEKTATDGDKTAPTTKKSKFKANANVSIVPRAVTKSALQREAAERDVLRREFLLKQEAVKATEIAIPFVFYDGTNLPGGVARVKKGDFTWIFLDKSRKVGAELGVGEKTNARREWARIGVDDLMLVRGGLIIPHHYEFLYFIMNKTLGLNNQILFDYSTDPPALSAPTDDAPAEPISTADKRAAKVLPDIATLEGASDDPTFTKVVDRRWYERNKHIYPASTWQDFDPEHDYQSQIRKDPRSGNTFFY
ncbi:XAP5 domain-containing protein [Apiospora kogelbergensis]|uniref:XAP5 domain-containing protein n=1 Tax=Apiospora kogelbergensis TaxID=1337665 RepID=A0AAW0QHM8_9PEZI